MERNTTRRLYDEFFIPRAKPDLYRPTHCKSVSVIDELTSLVDSYLNNSERNRFKFLMAKLDKAMYSEMEKKDMTLLRAMIGEPSFADMQNEKMQKWFSPGYRRGEDVIDFEGRRQEHPVTRAEAVRADRVPTEVINEYNPF